MDSLRDPTIDFRRGQTLSINLAEGRTGFGIGGFGVIALVRYRQQLIHEPESPNDFRSRWEHGNGADHLCLTNSRVLVAEQSKGKVPGKRTPRVNVFLRADMGLVA